MIRQTRRIVIGTLVFLCFLTMAQADTGTSSVEQFFEEVRGSLEKGAQVKLSGFGNFNLRDKKQRPGRNPKTGENIPITARRVVTFRPGQKLKARVEAYAGTQQQ